MFWKTKPGALKGTGAYIFILGQYHLLYRRTEQSFKRDGNFCLLTGTQFVPFDDAGIDPALAHIIPNSVYGKVCIELVQSPLVSSRLLFSQTL